jgi:hypothetical protein
MPARTCLEFIDDRLRGFHSALWASRSVCFAIAIASLIVGFATGPLLKVPILLILPVLLSAWHRGLFETFGLAIAMNAVHFGFHFIWTDDAPIEIAGINSVIFAAVVLIVAVLVHKAAIQTRLLRERVKTLEGFLPICAFCKDIRDDEGEWAKVECYIGARTSAQFTHTFCPTCAQVHFPELRLQPQIGGD